MTSAPESSQASGAPPPYLPPPAQPARRTGPLVGLGVLALALGVGGFFLGRSTAPKGPKTLAQAFQQASQGKLPCGQGPGAVSRACQGGAQGAGGQGGGFAGGRQGGGQGGGGLLGPGSVTGTVTSVSNGQVVLQTRAGTLTLTVTPQTQVTKTTGGTVADVINGARVAVSSTSGSGGNRTAQNIFVLPQVSGNGSGPGGE